MRLRLRANLHLFLHVRLLASAHVCVLVSNCVCSHVSDCLVLSACRASCVRVRIEICVCMFLHVSVCVSVSAFVSALASAIGKEKNPEKCTHSDFFTIMRLTVRAYVRSFLTHMPLLPKTHVHTHGIRVPAAIKGFPYVFKRLLGCV